MTKASPKEMLPVVDVPIIQIVVEELVEAGVTDIFIVTGYHKRSIEDHFDAPSAELWSLLENGKKEKLKKEVERIGNLANFAFVRQKGPYGNGTPLLNVRHLIGDEPFLYMWGDDFIEAKPVSRARQLIATYEKYGTPVLSAAYAKSDSDYDRYGVTGGEFIEKGVQDVKVLMEKPGKAKAPSNFVNMSGYLYTPDIFKYLEKAQANLKPGQELYWADAVILMLKDGKRVLAKEIEGGKYFDTGNKLEYMKTVVEFGLRHPEIGEEFGKWLKDL